MTATVAMILMACSLTAQAAHLKGFQVWNLKAHAAELRLTTNLTAVSASDSYGSKDCPCIGVDNIEGKTMALVKEGEPKESYPADLGARCEAWDLKDHPKCPGESWCAQQWCYVDPCNCNIPVLPKPASYLPDAQYQGKPLFFSYATCGGADSYTGKENKKDRETASLIKETCATDVSEKKWGEEDCRCVGVGPQPGTTKVNIGGKMVDFPASTGSTCNAWEKDNHPDCQGKDAPDWCNKAWCYVDPCKCKLATPPKTSSYLPEGNYQGKPVYYSYATCGAEDSFSAGDKKACVNQKTSSDCAKMDKCAWSGKQCLGKELVTVCTDGKVGTDEQDKKEKFEITDLKKSIKEFKEDVSEFEKKEAAEKKQATEKAAGTKAKQGAAETSDAKKASPKKPTPAEKSGSPELGASGLLVSIFFGASMFA